MTPAEAAEAMQKLLAANEGDPEVTHIAADLLLCAFLAMTRYYA